jgi:hypothetical protein
MMQLFANRKNKPVMGEKTPGHLRYVTTIMEWFPNAKIIHMLRDPRAIFASELRRRKRTHTTPYIYLKRINVLYILYILLQTTFLWFEGIYRYSKHKRLYPENYYLLKFEDLIIDPEKTIRQVCDFLEVEYQDEMLNQKVVSQGFQSGKSGFDTRAVERWRDYVSPWINTWFLFWFRKYFREFGYD